MMYVPLNTVGWPDWYLRKSCFSYKTSSLGSAQGGNLYVYGAKRDLDHASEYIIDHQAVSVTFIPPPATTYQDCLWNVSMTRSDTPGIWESIVVHADATDTFHFAGCSSTSGPMGRKCSNGTYGYKMKGANVLVTRCNRPTLVSCLRSIPSTVVLSAKMHLDADVIQNVLESTQTYLIGVQKQVSGYPR